LYAGPNADSNTIGYAKHHSRSHASFVFVPHRRRKIAALNAGRQNPWAKLYDPSRKTLKPRALADYITENANVAAQFRDYITPGSVKSVDEIRPEQGAVLRHGVKKIAT
jgi:hypothetical protein